MTAGGVCAPYTCPSCFESVDTCPDPGGGSQQAYEEDCPVCCRPHRIFASWDPDLDAFVVRAERES